MPRKGRKPGPTWDQLTEEQKIRLDKGFSLFLMVRNRRLAREAQS
ncbi:MAG: hypothetical protein AB9919_06730 [Geobacteraceae bacterium]